MEGREAFGGRSGTELAGYRIESLLGRGGMGVVGARSRSLRTTPGSRRRRRAVRRRSEAPRGARALARPGARRVRVRIKSGTDYFRGGGPPNFGWVHLGQGVSSTTTYPQRLITIMTAYAHTPSVVATVNVLRTRGHGATYEDTSPVKLGGFTGVQFDGQIVGPKNRDHNGHYFIRSARRLTLRSTTRTNTRSTATSSGSSS
jgi:hypothetical protein